MRKAAYVAGVLLIVLPACTSQQTGVGPTLPSPVNPASPAIAAITVGKELRDTFIGNRLTYDLTASSGGTLVARLSWDPRPNGAKLMLTLGDTSFQGLAPDWSPVVGRATVSAGQKYRVQIEEGQAHWDYGFNDPFVLTTSIEPGGAFDY